MMAAGLHLELYRGHNSNCNKKTRGEIIVKNEMGEEGSGIRGEGTEISLQLQRSFRFMPLSKEER